ncbi:uncharacterized protein [Porites lutea]|uniref:uncharacterized protein n=1 Tax=Porites lutea TaxID=51062 RepID=UPI003CC5D086
MKRTSNPGHPNAKQAEIPKARKVCNSSDEDECHEAFHLNPNQAKADITVTIKGTPVQVIDSGATANTIDYATYQAISAAKTVPLKPTNVKLHPYGEDNPDPIPLAGSFFGMINTPSGQMDLTRFLYLLRPFPVVFSGKIEKLNDYQLEFNIDSTVQPVVQNSRPTPLHYHANVEAKLKQLEDQDIIE